MADKQAVSDPLGGLSQILAALGGNKTTQSTNAGDTAALQQVLAQLQGTDYSKLLQSIFQQAGGAIPGMQAAYSNAVGARSTGNSAVQAALNKLLTQTTLAGQSQIAEQQLKNASTQAQAGLGIAQATRGTTSTQKSGTNMGQAATMLAGLQMLSKARGLFEGDSLLSKLTGGGATSGAQSSPVAGSVAVGTDLPSMTRSEPFPTDPIFEPTELPANFDQPFNLDELFGGGDMGAIDLSGLDFSQFDTSNSDLGGWVDPMTDGSFDGYLS